MTDFDKTKEFFEKHFSFQSKLILRYFPLRKKKFFQKISLPEIKCKDAGVTDSQLNEGVKSMIHWAQNLITRRIPNLQILHQFLRKIFELNSIMLDSLGYCGKDATFWAEQKNLMVEVIKIILSRNSKEEFRFQSQDGLHQNKEQKKSLQELILACLYDDVMKNHSWSNKSLIASMNDEKKELMAEASAKTICHIYKETNYTKWMFFFFETEFYLFIENYLCANLSKLLLFDEFCSNSMDTVIHLWCLYLIILQPRAAICIC